MANGSKVRELADAEAARAEATEPDDETTEQEEAEQTPTEPEPPTEPGPDPEAVSEADAAKYQELERAQEAYFKRVSKAIAPEPLPPPCMTCGGTGLDFAGHEAAPEFREHHKFIECDDCAGYGRVRTGSKVTGQELADCPKCVGRGFLEELPQIALAPDTPPTHGAPSWMGTAAPAPLP